MPIAGVVASAAVATVVVVRGRKHRRKEHAAQQHGTRRPRSTAAASKAVCKAAPPAAAAAAAAPTPGYFEIGDAVVVGGLQSAPEYNGLEGVVVEAPADVPDCGVELWLDGTHKTLLLPAECLRPAAANTPPRLGGNEYLAVHAAAVASWPADMERLLDPALPGGEGRRAALVALDVAGETT